ncbi:PQQ-binding-like beta-propeller repeat protein [Polymorphospora sp. NPDC051019]|uniref:PQQ-binding-like beta-propeller repeat protein n=1 Tax=Polymorphospora sp. NPDC051019 TaxID=3155725 RepID=UPI00343C9E8C
MRPRLLAETSVPAGDAISHVDGVGWLVARPAEQVVAVLDDLLRPTARIPVPTSGAAFEATVRGRHVAVVTLDHLAVVDLAGNLLWRRDQPVEAVGTPCTPNCFLDADGVLWVYVPGGDHLVAFDAATGREIDRIELESQIGAATFWPHPDRGRLGLHVVLGQDGSYSWLLRLDGDRIDCRELAGEVLTGFTSGGDRYLAMPHVDGEIGIHDAATGTTVAGCDADGIPGYPTDPEYILVEAAAVVSDDLVVVGVNTDEYETDTEEHLLLSTEDLRYVATVDYGQPMTTYAIRPAGGGGRWLTTGHDGDLVRLWRLPGPETSWST